jgi:hypothetical protein
MLGFVGAWCKALHSSIFFGMVKAYSNAGRNEMKGFKVIVALPDGKKSHFVQNLENNLSGAKAATDKIQGLYAQKGITPLTSVANVFDDQRELIPPPSDHLAGVTPDHRCWCGWHKRGECPDCPDELSFAGNPNNKN